MNARAASRRQHPSAQVRQADARFGTSDCCNDAGVPTQVGGVMVGAPLCWVDNWTCPVGPVHPFGSDHWLAINRWSRDSMHLHDFPANHCPWDQTDRIQRRAARHRPAQQHSDEHRPDEHRAGQRRRSRPAVIAGAGLVLLSCLLAAPASAATEPARPTTPADNRAGPVNDCARMTGPERDRCDRERGYGAPLPTTAPVGNMDQPPTSPTTAPRGQGGR